MKQPQTRGDDGGPSPEKVINDNNDEWDMVNKDF